MAEPKKCLRCDGKGVIPAFSHIRGGECFKCGGYGKLYPPSTSKVKAEVEAWNEGINKTIESVESSILELKASLNVWLSKEDTLPSGRVNRIKTAAIEQVKRKISESEEKIASLARDIKKLPEAKE